MSTAWPADLQSGTLQVLLRGSWDRWLQRQEDPQANLLDVGCHREIWFSRKIRVRQLCIGANWSGYQWCRATCFHDGSCSRGAASNPKRPVKAEEVTELFQECVALIREKRFLICRNFWLGETERKGNSNKLVFQICQGCWKIWKKKKTARTIYALRKFRIFKLEVKSV